jgi:putative component of membrane protein insertase Oxa1/YidC/SpoIIIJ protein YidD
MFKLQKQASTRQRNLSALWECLRTPHTYLALLALIFIDAAADSFRPAGQQWTAKTYIEAVKGYQRYGRPISQRFIQCRYRPTCSEYSLQAVREFGIRPGLLLTYKRISSCTRDVPMGTSDPIPVSY